MGADAPARPPADEAREILASARALLEELSEEGVERVDAPPPESTPPAPEAHETSLDPPAAIVSPTPEAAPERAPDTTPSAHSAQSDLLGERPVWGDDTTLDQVRERLGDCTRCGLSTKRTQIVFGDGNPNADLMFVGEGPGAEEDRRGLPFVGRAGELLTQMIEKGLEIPRSEVYICNIVKCRPPQNRTPRSEEAETCAPFLEGQIAAVRPKVIVALGKPAASLLLGRDVAITHIRGTWHEVFGIPLMPTLHPAYILRQYTAENRRAVWEDLKAAFARTRE